MTADLVNRNANARQHTAVVAVKIDGVRLTDPASANYVPWMDEAHLRYQLDGGQPVHTTNLSIEFRNLAPGEHQIQVALVGNDSRQIGETKTLTVHVPRNP